MKCIIKGGKGGKGGGGGGGGSTKISAKESVAYCERKRQMKNVKRKQAKLQ